jgi:hypothetical protein
MMNTLMFELMLNFRVAAQNMRTRASLRNRNLSSLLEDIDTSTYLPSKTKASSSLIGSSGDALAKNSAMRMSARKQQGESNAAKKNMLLVISLMCIVMKIGLVIQTFGVLLHKMISFIVFLNCCVCYHGVVVK